MLAIGEAASYTALKQLEDLGATTIILRSAKPVDDPSQSAGVDLLAFGLTYTDLARVKSTYPTVKDAIPMREYRKTVRNGEHKLEARILGITPDFLKQNNIRLAIGRGIDDLDEQRYENVAILGAGAADALFPTAHPIGKAITIDDIDHARAFTVIGVTEPNTLAVGSQAGDVDFNRVVFIPFATDRARFGRELITYKTGSFQAERLDISQIVVSVDSLANVQKTAAVIQSLIDQFHPRKDVTISVPLDLLQKAEQTQRLFTLILGAIASISLLVGGIGIMNIMLATVTERTREIGIRRALGARRRDIAAQFLVETLILSCGGGLLGVVLGLSAVYVVPQLAMRLWGTSLPTQVNVPSIFLSVCVSAAVGLLFGLYPARRAALMDPIEALRHE